MTDLSDIPEFQALTSYRHQCFVREFMVDRNAAQAAVRAGYAAATANNAGYRLMKRDDIRAAIEAIEALANQRATKNLDDVVEELTTIAFTGMSKFIRTTSQGDAYVDLSKCTPAELDLISEISVEDFVDGRGEDARDVRRVKVKLIDRLRALEKLGAHLGLGDKGEVGAVDRLTQAVMEINARGSAMPIGGQRSSS